MKNFRQILLEGPLAVKNSTRFLANFKSRTADVEVTVGLTFENGEPKLHLEVSKSEIEVYRAVAGVINAKEVADYQFAISATVDEIGNLRATRCISTDSILLGKLISSVQAETQKIAVEFCELKIERQLSKGEVDILGMPQLCCAMAFFNAKIPPLNLESSKGETYLKTFDAISPHAFNQPTEMLSIIQLSAGKNHQTILSTESLREMANQAIGFFNFATETYHPCWLTLELNHDKLVLQYFDKRTVNKSSTPVVHPLRVEKFLEESWMKILDSDSKLDNLHVPISWHCDSSKNYQNKLIHCITAIEYLINNNLSDAEQKYLSKPQQNKIQEALVQAMNSEFEEFSEHEKDEILARMEGVYKKSLSEKILLLLRKAKVELDPQQVVKLKKAIKIRNEITHKAIVSDRLNGEFWEAYQLVRALLCKIIFSRIGVNFEPEEYH